MHLKIKEKIYGIDDNIELERTLNTMNQLTGLGTNEICASRDS